MSRKPLKIKRFSWFLSLGLISITAVVVASKAMDTKAPAPVQTQETAPKVLFPVAVSRPAGPPVIQTGQLDAMGRPIVANCTTCHETKPPDARTRSGRELDEFHQGLVTNHGERTCLSCHNPRDYNQLRLADGKPVPFQEVMTLCAQCHGPQYKDYQNGAHGGMTGYWDLTKGPRARNNCIDCHDPHAPQYPQMMPVLRPNDRFFRDESSENAHD